MKILKELERVFFEIENEYSIKEFHARTKGHIRKEELWKRKRELNTHAYFLFLFTRLEDYIKTTTNSLIDDKQANISHWKTRAIWDNTDEKNIHFKKRVGLLTEKGQSEYAKIIEYYNLRNKIAHGGTVEEINTTINMIVVFNDMKNYFKSLKK